MPMRITLTVNGQPIETVKVTNRGATAPEEEHPDGERFYEWVLESSTRDNERRGGRLRHRRDRGATALAAAVLTQLDSQRQVGHVVAGLTSAPDSA